MEQLRECRKCGAIKPLADYHRAGRGHRGRCKECKRRENQEYGKKVRVLARMAVAAGLTVSPAQ